MYSVGTRFAWQRRARPPYAEDKTYWYDASNVVTFTGILSYILTTPVTGFINFWTTAGKTIGSHLALIKVPSRK